nr:hypothetical protein [Candidatus Parabeggiatoa sp.]
MMLIFQPNNDLIKIKNTPLKLISLVLLLFVLSAPTFATETLKMGTVFDKDKADKASLDFYYKGIDSARKAYPNITIERGDYLSTCDDATQKTERLITEKSVQVILSAEKDGCSSDIGKVAIQFSVLHISLIFLPTVLSLSSEELWLSVDSFEQPPKPAYIVLKAIEKPLSSDEQDEKNLILKVKQLYTVFLEQVPESYKVRVPFAPLRAKPARPGEYPDEKENKIKGNLKKGDLLEGKAIITDYSDIENHCKRDEKKGIIYDYVYTLDWICVRVKKSSHDSSSQGQTGWIHKMLVEKLHKD